MTKIDIESTCTVCGTTSKGTLTLKMPAREWVGLTSQEIYSCADDSGFPQEISTGDLQAFGIAIEAKLRKKNAAPTPRGETK